MSQISDWVREYVAGRLPYEQLRDRLADFPFTDPWSGHVDDSMTVQERNEVIDTEQPNTDGTLLELRDATVHLGLPWEVYRRLRSDLALPS